MEDKFGKRTNCLYCSKEMDAKYRNKKFCSDKCRVYYGRENSKVFTGIVEDNSDTKLPGQPINGKTEEFVTEEPPKKLSIRERIELEKLNFNTKK